MLIQTGVLFGFPHLFFEHLRCIWLVANFTKITCMYFLHASWAKKHVPLYLRWLRWLLSLEMLPPQLDTAAKQLTAPKLKDDMPGHNWVTFLGGMCRKNSMVLPSLLFQERSFNLRIFLNSKPTPCDFLSSLGFFPYSICGLSKGHTCFFFPEGRI